LGSLFVIGSGLAMVIAFPEGQYDFVMTPLSGSTVEATLSGKDHSGTVNASLVGFCSIRKEGLC